MVLLTSFGHRRAVLLVIVILIVAMSGVSAYSQRSQSGSQPISDLQAWPDLQQSMLAMHGAMASIQSTGNDDEDFVRLMLPHHQAALDMAKVELMRQGREVRCFNPEQKIAAREGSSFSGQLHTLEVAAFMA